MQKSQFFRMNGPCNHYRFPRACIALLLVGIGFSLNAGTITWTNIHGGDWSTASNWSPNQVPGGSDTALITTSGTYAITDNANIQVANLTLGAPSGIQTLTMNGTRLAVANGGMVGANGVLSMTNSTLAGLLTVNGIINLVNGGNLTGGSSLTVASNAVLNIGGQYSVYLNGVLTNAGTVNWSGTGTIYLYNFPAQGLTGGIVNLAGALFNVENDESISGEEGAPYFNNAGTVTKSAGVNTMISVAFNNSGVLNVASGTVTFSAGGIDSGITTGQGSVSVTGGTMTLNAAVPNLVVSGGTVDGINSSISNLTWSSGTLQGANTLTGTASWTSGTIGGGGSLTVASNAVLNIGGQYSVYLNGVLTNAGTVNWSGTGNLYLYNYAPQGSTGGIVNLAGALFNVENDESISGEEGSPYFINAGTFMKSAGVNTMVSLVFSNTGVLNVASGTVTLANGGVDSGINTGVGSLGVSGGTMTLNGAVPNLVVSGGTVDGVNASISNLTWTGGIMQGANTLTGTSSWTFGTIGGGGSLTVASNAVLNIKGQYSVTLNGVLTNAGTVNWSGTGNLYLYNYAPQGLTGGIVNLAGALFNVENDESISGEEGSPYFINAGTLLKSAGVNTTVSLVLSNTGVLNVASGTVTLANGGVDSGINTGAGSLSVTGGTLTLNGAVPNLILSGGTVNGLNTSISNLTWSGGTLQGANTLTGMSSWTFGTIGGGSSLTVAGNAVLNISGQYSLTLNGVLTNAGTVNWSGTGNLYLYNYASQGLTGGIVNLAGALFNVENDESISGEEGSPYFINAGTFVKTTGGSTTMGLPFNNTGTLALTVNSQSSFGQINFSGNAVLAGVLNVNFNKTYSPSAGDSFALLTYASETGAFSSVNVPTAPWQTNYLTYGSTALSLMIGSIYKLVFASAPATTNIAGASFAPTVIQAEYLNGATFATNGVPITMALAGGNGILSGQTTQNTDATGKATFTNLSINLVGPKTLEASSPPWVTPASNAVFIVPAAPEQLSLTKSIAYLQRQGYPFSPGPTVQILDRFGNVVSNSTLAITAESASSGGGTLQGSVVVNANGVNGTASFGGLYFSLGNSRMAESPVIYFASPGLVSVTNNPILVEFVSGLITLTNGNSSVLIDPNSQDGVSQWNVDGKGQLSQAWFWLRQDPSSAQVSFDQLGQPLGLSWTSASATINYLPQGLKVTLSFTLNGGISGSHASSLEETVSIQNTNNSPVSLHVYDYTDFDLNGESGGDTLSFPSTNLVLQQGKATTATQSVQGQTPSFWEGSWYALTLDKVQTASPAMLSDQITPNQPGDQTFAYQWDVSLAAGQTFVVTLNNSVQPEGVLLEASLSGGDVIISWPTNGSAGLRLQSSTRLGLGAAWTSVTNEPAVADARYQVTLSQAGAAQFFRLQQ
jgi:hypothetical protein